MKDWTNWRWMTGKELGSLVLVKERDTLACVDPWLTKEDRLQIILQNGRRLSVSEILNIEDDGWMCLDGYSERVPNWAITDKPLPRLHWRVMTKEEMLHVYGENWRFSEEEYIWYPTQDSAFGLRIDEGCEMGLTHTICDVGENKRLLIPNRFLVKDYYYDKS